MGVLDMAYKMSGADGVKKMIDAMAEYDADPEKAQRDQHEAIDRAQELIKESRGTPDGRNDDISALTFAAGMAFGTDRFLGAMMLKVALSTAYDLGVRDARLEVFKSAEVKDEV